MIMVRGRPTSVWPIIRKTMNWFATRDDYYVSPVVRGMHRSNGGDHKRKRILNDDEIRALWKAADGTFGAMLKVALLTAQRKDKVATMKWDDIKDGVWTIASEKREKSNAGSLQLPKAVLDIINKQPCLAGNPHIFPAGRGDGPFISFATQKQARRQAAAHAELGDPRSAPDGEVADGQAGYRRISASACWATPSRVSRASTISTTTS